jgi:KUP system potassium uptake protein
VGLAAVASIIASQALITGAFSLTMQAIQLGLLPRMSIKHTSEEERGQIYLPFVNWALMFACLGLVAGFRSSSNLAAAYGIAVSLTMVITSVLFYPTARLRWRWPAWKAGLACGTFLVLEAAFLASNSLKITHGGWFPLLIGAGLFGVMATWRLGRRIIGTRLAQGLVPWNLFLEDLRQNPPHRIKGTSVFLAGNPAGVPIALLHNLKHNRVLHQRVVILHIATSEEPRVEPEERVSIEPIGESFTRVTGRFGYMEEPNIETVLRNTILDGLRLHAHEVTFFLSRETIVPSKIPSMARWRVQLFSFLARNSQSATAFFGLPPNRVIELGMQVQL